MNKLTNRKVITQDPAARRAAFFRALEAKAKQEAEALRRAEKARAELRAMAEAVNSMERSHD